MRVRAKKRVKYFPLHAAGGTGAIVDWVEWDAAERMVAEGTAKRKHDPVTARCVGYRLLQGRAQIADGISKPSSSVLSAREIDLIVCAPTMKTMTPIAIVAGGCVSLAPVAQGEVELARVKLEAFRPQMCWR